MILAPARCGELLRARLRSRGISSHGLRRPLVGIRGGARAAALALPRDMLALARAEALSLCPEAEAVEALCSRKERPPPPGASYVIVGEAAILSLDERLRGRDREVAERILAAHPGLRAVYGKDATRGEFRVQQLRLLAGTMVDETIYVEHGLRYPVRLGKVYVNPRLATEHARIVEAVRPGEALLDMFSGFGGFSLLAASTGKPKVVVANDLNPYAYEALVKAVELNKTRIQSPLLVLNMDAAALPGMLRPIYDRILMNLPHAAYQFLDVARSLCSPRGCIIHLYTVAPSPQEAASRTPSWARLLGVTRVLDYAPRRFIYRVDLLAGPKRDH